MRIDPTAIASLGEARARGTTAPKTDEAGVKNDPSSVVKLGIAARTDATSIEPAVAAKIERVKALLAQGNYPVDLDKLASRITDDEFDRGGVK
ncbi:MAG: flagellar biosynthesis anti-sigma factor FlgM [Deltaproteobacteria bacterium]|nr:flagellar biosynthesis anti-sigma factor FlgM [Deltaproteobacteria bacterium]